MGKSNNFHREIILAIKEMQYYSVYVVYEHLRNLLLNNIHLYAN
jgi:hypothetical protein